MAQNNIFPSLELPLLEQAARSDANVEPSMKPASPQPTQQGKSEQKLRNLATQTCDQQMLKPMTEASLFLDP